jgi:hypothetical protein
MVGRRIAPLLALIALLSSTFVPLGAGASAPQRSLYRWQLEYPEASPGARTAPAMAYDALTKKTAVFGGCGGFRTENVTFTLSVGAPVTMSGFKWCAGKKTFGDTWLWNGSGWSQPDLMDLNSDGKADAPPARFEAGMAFDQNAKKLVLFGGTFTVVGEVSPAPLPPSADAKPCMHSTEAPPDVTSDPSRGTLPHVPSAKITSAKFFDAALGREQAIYFYCFDDTWTLSQDGVTGKWRWDRQAPATKPRARFSAGMAYDANGQPTLIAGCTAQGLVAKSGGGFWWDCHYYEHVIGNDTYRETNYIRDTWVWKSVNGTYNWVRLGGPNEAFGLHGQCKDSLIRAPDCRRGISASTTWNPANFGTVTVIGGYWCIPGCYNAQAALGDFWEWDTKWWKVCPLGALEPDGDCTPPENSTPGLRAFAHASYAWLDGAWRILLFGGRGNGELGDTWYFTDETGLDNGTAC